VRRPRTLITEQLNFKGDVMISAKEANELVELSTEERNNDLFSCLLSRAFDAIITTAKSGSRVCTIYMDDSLAVRLKDVLEAEPLGYKVRMSKLNPSPLLGQMTESSTGVVISWEV